jgi:hypothetical protein
VSEAEWVADAAIKTIQMGESAIRNVWSLMEAATEKKRPSEVLSPEAVRRMQGKRPGQLYGG